jgi:hypothetical protein
VNPSQQGQAVGHPKPPLRCGLATAAGGVRLFKRPQTLKGFVMRRDAWHYIIAALFCTAFLVALFGVFRQSANTTAFVALLAIMAGALILIALLPYLTEFYVGPKGVGGKLSRLEERQDTLDSRLRAIQFTLTGLVSKNEYPKLIGLTQEEFLVNYHPEMYQELKHLDAMGFLRPRGDHGLVDTRNQYAHREQEQFDLKEFVEITEKGREYLKLLDKLVSSQ